MNFNEALARVGIISDPNGRFGYRLLNACRQEVERFTSTGIDSDTVLNCYTQEPESNWPHGFIEKYFEHCTFLELALAIDGLGLADQDSFDEYWQRTPRDILEDILDTFVSEAMKLAAGRETMWRWEPADVNV